MKMSTRCTNVSSGTPSASQTTWAAKPSRLWLACCKGIPSGDWVTVVRMRSSDIRSLPNTSIGRGTCRRRSESGKSYLTYPLDQVDGEEDSAPVQAFCRICTGCGQLRCGIHKRAGDRLGRRTFTSVGDRPGPVQRVHIQSHQRAPG
jgi:hypothetical protein